MKKNLQKVLALLAFSMLSFHGFTQTRYMHEVFANVSVTSNIEYDSNSSVNLLYGAPGLPPSFTGPLWFPKLMCDIYQPTGDTELKRPLIILASTGSFLPPIINKQPTGSRKDSSIVQIATKFAMRGYVVAVIDYRGGWNPATTIQEQARMQLIQAAYRGMQDARNAVRFLRTNATTYKIDTAKIIVGGQGTGGYISLGVGTVSRRADIESNAKFLKANATPMVSVDTLGDWTGAGGIFPYVYSADASVSSNVHMVFNIGGAMGDSAWMKPTSLPMIGLHCAKDPFAPFNTGNVIVPTTGITVIPNASGAGDVIPKANAMGLNAKMMTMMPAGSELGISTRAYMMTKMTDNLYPFATSFPFEGAPWEWWDRTTVQSITSVSYRGIPLPANGREADSLSMLTNPFMSAARGKAYCDTIVRYIAPRIALQFGLASDVELSNFNLAAPSMNANIDIYNDSTKKVTFRWTKSTMVGAGVVGYIWMMDTVGNWFMPVKQAIVGTADSLVVLQSELFASLTAMGVALNGTKTLKWEVIANNNIFSRGTIPGSVNLTKKQLVGLNESVLNDFISVYPNPATSNIKVSLDDSKSPITQINVLDITGRNVISLDNLNTHNQTVSLSGLSTGMYLINITTANGATGTKRFLVQ